MSDLCDRDLMALVLGSVMLAVDEAPGKPTKSELLAKAHETADMYVGDKSRVDSMFDDVLERMGMLVVLGDEVSLSERGKLMLDINQMKMSIAEVMGDMDIDLDEEQAQRVRDASPDVPG